MRIGIDARFLSGCSTGHRNYWRGLIGGLAKVDTQNKYFLYHREPLEGDLSWASELGPNFHWRRIPWPSQDALWMLGSFPDALKSDQIDIAHTQYNIPLLWSPCPVVTTVHDLSFRVHPEYFLPKDRRILNALVPRSMQKAAHVIAVSESTRRDILRYYRQIGKDKVSVVQEAADSRFAPPQGGQEMARAAANHLLGATDSPYILSVGVLQPRKNLATLLDGFALIKLGPDPPPHRLVIVGKRGWLDETDAEIANLPQEVACEIILAGYVADDDLPTLYGGADAFCYPSRYEGFGLPPLEALACGCPVLSSRSSSLPEVVGDAGILLPADDSNAWANALAKLLSSPKVLDRWRSRGPEHAAQFSWERAARETLTIYEKIKKIP